MAAPPLPPDLEASFLRDGYVVVPGAWSNAECDRAMEESMLMLEGKVGEGRTRMCCAVLCCAVSCCAVLCCAVPCCAVPCRAVPCCAVLCRAGLG